jgi:hypothetical protein
MQVSDSAAPAVLAGDYLFPCADSATPGHMQRAAVAVGPADTFGIGDGESNAAGAAAAPSSGSASGFPPVVVPGAGPCDGAASDGVDGGAGGDDPDPTVSLVGRCRDAAASQMAFAGASKGVCAHSRSAGCIDGWLQTRHCG